MTTTKASSVKSSTVTTPDVTTWWLKDPLNSANNMPIFLAPGTFDASSEDRQNIIQLLNRPDPVVLSDVIQLPTITATFVFVNEVAYQQFNNWRQLQRIGLFQGPYPVGHWYVRLGQTTNVKLDIATLRGWATPNPVLAAQMGWASPNIIKRAVDVTMQAVAAP